MSYCRFSEADAYIFASGDKIHCCWCMLDESGADFVGTEEEMLEHVAKHRAAGHDIPLDVDERLKQEIAERSPPSSNG